MIGLMYLKQMMFIKPMVRVRVLFVINGTFVIVKYPCILDIEQIYQVKSA